MALVPLMGASRNLSLLAATALARRRVNSGEIVLIWIKVARGDDSSIKPPSAEDSCLDALKRGQDREDRVSIGRDFSNAPRHDQSLTLKRLNLLGRVS